MSNQKNEANEYYLQHKQLNKVRDHKNFHYIQNIQNNRNRIRTQPTEIIQYDDPLPENNVSNAQKLNPNLKSMAEATQT